MNPNSDFHVALTNPYFNNVSSRPLALIILNCVMIIDEELMEDFSTIEIEVSKMKTLTLYLHFLQLKGEYSLGFSHITKYNHDAFK